MMLISVDNPVTRGVSSSNMQNILRAKCVVVGDPAVGKSSITQAFCTGNNNFQKNYNMTTTVDLKTKKVSVPDTDDAVELHIYDSSGKDIYLSVLTQLWHHTSMICLVFDVADEQSFQNCKKHLEEVRNVAGQSTIPGVLIGNKIDLNKRRVVSTKAASDFAHHLNLRYFECSTKDNTGVDEPFFFLVSEWHKLYLEKTEMFKTLT